LDGRPLLAFLKVRSVVSALGFSVAGWLYLILAGPSVEVPFGQRAVPSPLIWPAAAAVSTMLVSRSRLACWEAPAPRRLWPYRLSAVAGCVLANVAALMVVAPTFGRIELLTWFATLQASALVCSVLCGDQAWLPLSALILVAMFELAQDGSPVLDLIDAAAPWTLAITSGLVVALAVLSARGRPTSAPPRTRSSG
jgi:hypothetical protein